MGSCRATFSNVQRRRPQRTLPRRADGDTDQGERRTVSDVTPISELFERGASRGYVLLSELQELYDPLSHSDNWVDDMAQKARDLGMQVLDDLVEDADRPEATPLSASSDSVRQYLNEIGRTDLLTPEQEVDLAKRYQAGLAAAIIIGAGEKLTPRRKAQLRMIKRGGERAKDHMIRANLRLVVSVARKFRGSGRRPALAHPGGQPRPDPRRREVRPHQGLQVLDLRHLVDPPGAAARAGQHRAHRPPARPRARADGQGPLRRVRAAPAARP